MLEKLDKNNSLDLENGFHWEHLKKEKQGEM
jgi:hypothetical protein